MEEVWSLPFKEFSFIFSVSVPQLHDHLKKPTSCSPRVSSQQENSLKKIIVLLPCYNIALKSLSPNTWCTKKSLLFLQTKFYFDLGFETLGLLTAAGNC